MEQETLHQQAQAKEITAGLPPQLPILVVVVAVVLALLEAQAAHQLVVQAALERQAVLAEHPSPMLVAVVVVFKALVVLAAQGAVALVVVVLAQVATAQPTLVVEAVVTAMLALTAVQAAQASSSFPILAHKNLVAVSSLLLVATQFIHSRLLAH